MEKFLNYIISIDVYGPHVTLGFSFFCIIIIITKINNNKEKVMIRCGSLHYLTRLDFMQSESFSASSNPLYKPSTTNPDFLSIKHRFPFFLHSYRQQFSRVLNASTTLASFFSENFKFFSLRKWRERVHAWKEQQWFHLHRLS